MCRVPFEILDDIVQVRTIAVGRRIRELKRLRKVYGPARWRKMKGVARVRLPDDTIAHGHGRKEFKAKRLLPEEP